MKIKKFKNSKKIFHIDCISNFPWLSNFELLWADCMRCMRVQFNNMFNKFTDFSFPTRFTKQGKTYERDLWMKWECQRRISWVRLVRVVYTSFVVSYDLRENLNFNLVSLYLSLHCQLSSLFNYIFILIPTNFYEVSINGESKVGEIVVHCLD